MTSSGFSFGSAKVDITPRTGLPMAGYSGRTAPAEGAHSPLYARAFVCQGNGNRVALASVDVIGIGRDDTNAIRRKVEDATGIPPERILIATTHSHSGPVTTYFRTVQPDPAYMQALGDGITEAAGRAAANVRPARMGFAQGEAARFHMNRRDKAQPTDPTLSVARFVDERNRTLGAWVNYGCHPTNVGNLFYSSEYCGVLCNVVEGELEGTAMFLNGCHGDVNPHRPNKNFDDVETMGKGLADVALGLLRDMNYTEPNSVGGGSAMVQVPLDAPPTLAALKAMADAPKGPAYEKQWARDWIAVHEAGKPIPATTEIEFQWFRIGELTLVCFPGQVFSSWGLELRRRWAGGPLMIVNQANDHAGYFPDKLGWEKGGYEVRSAFKFNSDRPAPTTWEAGKRLVETALSVQSLV
ncbi:MAG: neutral/alkaline non-lysosomal ceramidase N-terminal domain-containing protein [Planctomycetota bacterium]